MDTLCENIRLDLRVTPDINSFTEKEEDVGLFRDTKPTHVTYKVESFSMFAKTSLRNFESNDFESGGYKWKLSIYPDGNKNDGGEGYVSLYLVISDTSSLPAGWEVNVNFRFFLLDQTQDEYLILGDMGGRTRRFHEERTEWGFPTLVPVQALNNSVKGYLVNDTCIFGAEVLVCKNTGNVDTLTMVKEPTTVHHTWEIKNFSRIDVDHYNSTVFSAGDYKWYLELHPVGDSTAIKEGLSAVSLYLCLVCPATLSPGSGRRLCVRETLRIRDQIHGQHRVWTDDCWFPTINGGWGWKAFMKLSEINEQSNGFLVNDTCIIEAEVTILGLVHKLP